MCWWCFSSSSSFGSRSGLGCCFVVPHCRTILTSRWRKEVLLVPSSSSSVMPSSSSKLLPVLELAVSASSSPSSPLDCPHIRPSIGSILCSTVPDAEPLFTTFSYFDSPLVLASDSPAQLRLELLLTETASSGSDLSSRPRSLASTGGDRATPLSVGGEGEALLDAAPLKSWLGGGGIITLRYFRTGTAGGMTTCGELVSLLLRCCCLCCCCCCCSRMSRSDGLDGLGEEVLELELRLGEGLELKRLRGGGWWW